MGGFFILNIILIIQIQYKVISLYALSFFDKFAHFFTLFDTQKALKNEDTIL